MSLLSNTTDPHRVTAILEAPGVAMTARVLLTCPFWISGLSKLLNFSSAVGEATHFGLQPAPLLAVVIILIQLAGSLMVILNYRTWIGAGALGGFTILASFVGHAFWSIPDPVARFHDMNAFLANLGLVGGLALVAALAEHEKRR